VIEIEAIDLQSLRPNAQRPRRPAPASATWPGGGLYLRGRQAAVS